MAKRIVQTTWTDYRSCDDGKHYNFRISVELEGINGSDPQYTTRNTIVEMLQLTAEAWRDLLEGTEDDDND